MNETSDIQLHFDVLSCRALLCCEGKDYVLPDTYPTREAAEAAARKFAREKLGAQKRRSRRPADIAVWLR
jgi:hypothetical protein